MGNLMAKSNHDISTNDVPKEFLFLNDSKLLLVGNSSADDGFMPEIVLFCFKLDGNACNIRGNEPAAISQIPINPYPNPFNENVMIRYLLPISSKINISCSNIVGDLIFSRDIGFQQPGAHDYEWSPKNLSSGIYIVKIESENQRSFCRVLLLK